MRFEELLSGAEIVRRAGPNAEDDRDSVASSTTRDGCGPVRCSSPCRAKPPTAIATSARPLNRAQRQSSRIRQRSSPTTAKQYPGAAIAEVPAGGGRRAMAAIAANFFGHPERQLALSGVTGTNGKTTTAFLLEAMLNSVGRKTVLVGTIENHVAGVVRAGPAYNAGVARSAGAVS